VTGYHVDRCQGAGCTSFTQIGTTTGTATTYKDTTAAAGTSYRLPGPRQRRRRQPRPLHRPRQRDHPEPHTTPPGKPGTLTATPVGASEVDLSWGAATDNVGVTGYHIERCSGSGCSSYTEIGTTTGTATTYKDTTTAASTSYRYQVRANDAAGNLGPYRDPASATTGAGSGIQVTYQSTDANGVQTYQVTSADDGTTPQVLRVPNPTNPTPGEAHNFLYVLPVEAGLGTVYGDGLETMRALDVQDQYNLTIIEPSFAVDPWYADNPNDQSAQYETFMTYDLAPWVTQHLAVTVHEQNWLIGFSKSGIGGEDLILKHPDVFTLAASWDFPADMSSYDQFGSSSANSYGTDANFQAYYRLTSAFVSAHKTPFLTANRIWIGGYSVFQADMRDYDSLLTSAGLEHTTETPQDMAHTWTSGWVPIALAALNQDSLSLASTPSDRSPSRCLSPLCRAT
jgi:chitodextrinase